MLILSFGVYPPKLVDHFLSGIFLERATGYLRGAVALLTAYRDINVMTIVDLPLPCILYTDNANGLHVWEKHQGCVANGRSTTLAPGNVGVKAEVAVGPGYERRERAR